MGPDDPIGTVRATDGLLAVRAHSPDADHSDDLIWFLVDVGGNAAMPASADDWERFSEQISDWPIVYQP